MASMVCRGLQSGLESHLIEPRTIQLKMYSSKPHDDYFSQPIEMAFKPCFSLDSSSKFTTKQISDKRHSDVQQATKNAHDLGGGWSFLQSLSSTNSQNPKKSKDNEEVYVHPLVKRSKSTLTKKSLELCTENLGNETGSDFIENSSFDVSVTSSSEKKDTTNTGNSQTREHHEVMTMQTSSQLLGAKKMISENFPPPLTTIRGSESLGVRAHREDGRLIIEAVKVEPPKQSYLQAERSLGRLRLYFVKSCSTNHFDSENDQADNEFQSEEEIHDEEEYDRKIESDDQLIDDDDNGDFENYEGKKDKILSFGHEMGMEKFERPCRCKEGHENENNNGLMLNWETFWVAT